MSSEGGCLCGAIRYRVEGAPQRAGICHCSDCRRASGAPLIAWAIYPRESFTLTAGSPRAYNSSPDTFRHFCADCGTGLYYVNEVVLPGLVDIQLGSLDDAAAVTPTNQIQTAERLEWVARLHELPAFPRWPE